MKEHVSESTYAAGFRLLRKANVQRMFVAYLVSYVGTAMAPIAMAFGVLELTGSAQASATVIAAPTLASIGVLLFGGVLADRTSRQRLIVGADLLAMATQFALSALFISGLATVPTLAGLMLINGVAVALHAPARSGLVVQLVKQDELQATNALLGTARNGALALGATLGGLLVAAFGAGVTLLIDGLTFGISALLVASLKPAKQEQLVVASLIEDLRLGWREFISHTWLWVIVLQFSLIVAAGESLFGLIGPAVTLDEMGGVSDWKHIATSFGLGTLTGGVVGMIVKPSHPMRFATCCVFFFSGTALAMIAPMPLPAIIIASFVAGLAGQIFSVLWYTSLQLHVPTHLLSRVSAYDHLGSIILAPLGIVAAGFAYDSLGYQTTLSIIAAMVILPTLAALCVKDVRSMTNDQPMQTQRRTEEATKNA